MNIARSAAIATGTKQIAINLSQEVKAMLGSTRVSSRPSKAVLQTAEPISRAGCSRWFAKVSNLSLSGIRCADTWIGPDNNFYALMIADPDAVKTALTQMKASVSRCRLPSTVTPTRCSEVGLRRRLRPRPPRSSSIRAPRKLETIRRKAPIRSR